MRQRMAPLGLTITDAAAAPGAPFKPSFGLSGESSTAS